VHRTTTPCALGVGHQGRFVMSHVAAGSFCSLTVGPTFPVSPSG
jgi:hypothetical protein